MVYKEPDVQRMGVRLLFSGNMDPRRFMKSKHPADAEASRVL